MPDARVFTTAPAKVNLFLHVGERRADGYHSLESLVAFAAFGDGISIERDDGVSLTITGPFGATLSAADDNLALKAAHRLAEQTGMRAGARITLEKNIPVAAGLGGGSADAAAVLRGLNGLWNLGLDRDALRAIGATIGADVPICIDSTVAWMEGKGERITSLPPPPDIWLLLVNPGVPISTARVFEGLRQRRGLGLQCPTSAFADVCDLVDYLRSTTNDLEAPACEIAPVIGEVLDELGRTPDVLLARMSGSGATCFGVFANREARCSAMDSLRERHSDWWLAATNLISTTRTSVIPGEPRLRGAREGDPGTR